MKRTEPTGQFYFAWGNGKLERAFWEFHLANPEVYRLLVHYAKQWKARHLHCSISFLFERVRWQMNIQVNASDLFKLNNNHRAFYARLIEEQEGWHEFFRMRTQRIQSSFGPANSRLPSGEHVA
jgi:hypothetical protein